MAKGATPDQWLGSSSHMALSRLTASMPPVNVICGGSGMSSVSTERGSPATNLSVMERSWVWASAVPGEGTAAGWDCACSMAPADPTGVGGGATAPVALGARGFLSAAAASPARTDWMRVSTWLGWMASWSFGFGGDGAAVVGGAGEWRCGE